MLVVALLASCVAGTARDTSADLQLGAPQGNIAGEQAASSADTTAAAPVDVQVVIPHGSIAMEHIKFMNDNLYGRTSFTYRELETALWIAQELLAMGHMEENITVQGFSWEDVYQWIWDPWEVVVNLRDFFREFPAREGRLSQNVILSVPGQSEQVIVVGAHYDSFPYPGASDNASGTALLLESAQRMLYQDNYYTIVYVFFGAEEVGILGSHFFLDSLSDEQRDNIVFMVNADVLLESPYILYSAGYLQDDELGSNAITRQVDSIAAEIYNLYDIEIGSSASSIFLFSDHLPFLEDGFTVVFLASLYVDLEGAFESLVLHTYRDCIHYINENWPGKAQRAMHAYSVFLERILLDIYS